MKRKAPTLRVHVPEVLFPLPREGFLVCVGVGLKPWRRCHWRALAFYSHRTHGLGGADDHLPRLDAEAGRAVIDLSNPHLQLINDDGALQQCAAIEDRLLS